MKALIKFKHPCLPAIRWWIRYAPGSARLGYACKRTSHACKMQERYNRSAPTNKARARAYNEARGPYSWILMRTWRRDALWIFNRIYLAWPRSNPLFIPAATSARACGFRAKIGPGAEDEWMSRWNGLVFVFLMLFFHLGFAFRDARHFEWMRNRDSGNLMKISETSSESFASLL